MSAFCRPLRHIFDAADVEQWINSPTCEDFSKFIGAVNAAVHGQKNSCICPTNETLNRLISVLDELAAWIDEIKPIAQPMRYGNKAFRSWHARLVKEGERLCKSLLPSGASAPATSAGAASESSVSTAAGGAGDGGSAEAAPAAESATARCAGAEVELLAYLLDSFGNATRIDYGTGHESTFMILVYCLAKLGLVGPADLTAVGTKVFPRYMSLVRKLQRTYWLEPAGSHGVWSLDDYQMLAFVFGSSQLQGHAHIKPRSIHNPDVLEGYAREYLYLSSIAFIGEVKQGAPFAEHSPILWDISQLPSWARANEGLLKMHRGEVLGKLPVVQHLAFGSLFPATWPPSRQPVLSETLAHALAATSAEPAVAAAAARAEAISAAASVPVDDPLRAVAPWVTSPPAAASAAPHSAAGGGSGVLAAEGAAAAGGAAASSGSAAAAAGGAAAGPAGEGAARRRSRGASAGDGVVAFIDAFGQPPAGAIGGGGPVAAAAAADKLNAENE